MTASDMGTPAGSSNDDRLESTGNAPPTLTHPASSDTQGATTPAPDENPPGEESIESTEAEADASNTPKKKSRASRSFRGRTFRDIVQNHPRTEPTRIGTKGYTVRELCSTMHIAADSLRAAYTEPGRLTLNGIAALAAKMGEDPLQIAADILAEMKAAERTSGKTGAAKRNRASKVISAAKSGNKAAPTDATAGDADTTADAESPQDGPQTK